MVAAIVSRSLLLERGLSYEPGMSQTNLYALDYGSRTAVEFSAIAKISNRQEPIRTPQRPASLKLP
jgi:hypothetical protein